MSETLRGGVIGAGVFGTYHARQYARLEGVELIGVLDPHPERAAGLAMPLGGRAFARWTWSPSPRPPPSTPSRPWRR